MTWRHDQNHNRSNQANRLVSPTSLAKTNVRRSPAPHNVPSDVFFVAPLMVRVDEVIWSDDADVYAGDSIRIDPAGVFSEELLSAFGHLPTPKTGWKRITAASKKTSS